jgi:poly-beta-1,6-N-acetyl-D-glucosamine N-deacetylase
MNPGKWYRQFFYKILVSGQSLFKWKNRKAIRVLAYHGISDVSLFEKQIKYLRKNYHIISIHDLEDFIYYQKPLPAYSVLLTFDDGDISLYTYGLPIFKKYNIPAVIFIITGLIGTNSPFWWNLVRDYYGNKGEHQNGRATINKLKTIPNNERVSVLEKIKEEMPDYYQAQFTVEHMQEMIENNVVLANHSHSHPMFDKITEEEFTYELKQAREFYNQMKIEGYPWFAFPNGNNDVGREKLLKEMGITLAFLFDHKLNKSHIHPYRISRIRVNAYDALSEFKVRVSGLHSLLMNK